MQVPLGARGLSGFVEPDEERRMVGWIGCPLALELSFRISSNLTSRKIVLSRLVVPFVHSDSIVDTIPLYSYPIFVRKTACRIMLAPLVVNSESSVVRLQTSPDASW